MLEYSFPKEEKETIIHFDYAKQEWAIRTSVPSHITFIKKRFPYDVLAMSGNHITEVETRIPKSYMSLRGSVPKDDSV